MSSEPFKSQSRQRQGALVQDNSDYIQSLYEDYQRDPNSVAENWQHYFLGIEHASGSEPLALGSGPAAIGGKQGGAYRLINAYRTLGHLAGKIDPLGLSTLKPPARLRREDSGLGAEDEHLPIKLRTLDASEALPLRRIETLLQQIYCGTLCSEYYHLSSARERAWIRSRLERTHGLWEQQHSPAQRRAALQHVHAAEGLEKYLHRRFTGQKRFSLEGCEALIPLLKQMIEEGSEQGVSDIVIGMAHRGRLNVLVNIFGKSPDDLVSEFEGRQNINTLSGSGDVKYHQGFYSNLKTRSGNIHLSLAFNPSHLEIVYPVVEGGVRARQDRDESGRQNRSRVLPLIIHGDAAFAGQGVVTETLNLSRTKGYGTAGTVHVVINNQIGFTTSNPREARSTPYCTDVAKVIEAPIFHVNANDIDAVLYAARLALAYRNTFGKDAVIDLVGYRRHGHNEADEPMLTQPLMYQAIRAMPTITQLYGAQLTAEGVLTPADADAIEQAYRARLEHGEPVVAELISGTFTNYAADWDEFLSAHHEDPVDTRVALPLLQRLGAALLALPPDFEPHRRIAAIWQERSQMLQGERELDWGMAENLAYASLLQDGVSVRLSGQDSGRGTFSHRHAVVHNQTRRGVHVPLQNIEPQQPRFEVINSLLSELAVLAFEYGYATSSPHALVIWEAQFGDFANMAQAVVDQFICSGNAKWGRLCQLTLFLPHGYEGQGPEHSSARLERFLQLCAELNMRVWVPTTPAQLFHLLRNQALRHFRRPLVVMMPKSLLRHPLSKSSLADLHDHGLQLVLGEQDPLPAQQVRRIVLCSGKVYFDLLQARRERGESSVALVRVEQLYPFPRSQLQAALAGFGNAVEVAWCQEEPRNQGAWYQIQHHLQSLISADQVLAYVGKPRSASTACGLASMHERQQQAVVDTALGIEPLTDLGNRLDDY